jgi:hypothetical protein
MFRYSSIYHMPYSGKVPPEGGLLSLLNPLVGRNCHYGRKLSTYSMLYKVKNRVIRSRSIAT